MAVEAGAVPVEPVAPPSTPTQLVISRLWEPMESISLRFPGVSGQELQKIVWDAYVVASLRENITR